ncbi:MAG: hypothetical protein IJ391_04445 [Clostridia bacterium]|nr:hypothetical protein [Clostridia bacterium]
MPYIATRTNKTIDEKTSLALKSELGKAIATIPGKSEAWLMVENIGDCDLYFKGENNETLVFAEVKIYGKASAKDLNELTCVLTDIYTEILDCDPANVYVKYEEVTYWGWNARNL